MIDNKYAAVIIGFGGMGNWHREILGDFDHLFCAGVYDIDPARQEYARTLGLRSYDSLEEVLNDDNVDIVVVATPNDLHRDIAIKAMKSGKAVVSEKPVTISSEDLQAMIDCANESGVLFTVHQNRRWDEDFLTMKKIFETKALGEVFNIESRVHGSRGIPGDWRGRKTQGGGMVLDWGVHLFDQILQMIPGKISTVYAKMHHVTNYEVDDGFRAIFTFDSGVTVLVEVGTSNFISLPRWYMQGENGTAIIEDFCCEGEIISIKNWDIKDAVPVRTAAGLTKTMAPRTDETITRSPLPDIKSDIHDFYRNVTDTIAGRASSLIKHDELMRCMKLMEAAFKSDEIGQIVEFEK